MRGGMGGGGPIGRAKWLVRRGTGVHGGITKVGLLYEVAV